MLKHFLRAAATEYLQNEHGLPIKPTTLANLAGEGRGPKFKMFSRRALYSRQALDEWANEQTAATPQTTDGTRAIAP